MTRPSAVLEAHRERILELARKHGARNVRVFGSAARGTLAGLQQELSQLLGVPVDVRTPAQNLPLHPRARALGSAPAVNERDALRPAAPFPLTRRTG